MLELPGDLSQEQLKLVHVVQLYDPHQLIVVFSGNHTDGLTRVEYLSLLVFKKFEGKWFRIKKDISFIFHGRPLSSI